MHSKVLIFHLGSAMPPTTKKLNEILQEKVDWFTLGHQLDIDIGALENIKENHHTANQRLIVMLKKWQDTYPERGWSHIVDALRKLGLNNLADKVNVEYCSDVSSVTSSCYSEVEGIKYKHVCIFLLLSS